MASSGDNDTFAFPRIERGNDSETRSVSFGAMASRGDNGIQRFLRNLFQVRCRTIKPTGIDLVSKLTEPISVGFTLLVIAPAADRNRTGDLLTTNEVRYRLCHSSIAFQTARNTILYRFQGVKLFFTFMKEYMKPFAPAMGSVLCLRIRTEYSKIFVNKKKKHCDGVFIWKENALTVIF